MIHSTSVERTIYGRVRIDSAGPTAGVRHTILYVYIYTLTVIAKAGGQTVTAGPSWRKLKTDELPWLTSHATYIHEYNVYIVSCARIEGWSFLTAAHLLCVIGPEQVARGIFIDAIAAAATALPPSPHQPSSICPTRSRRVPPTPSNNDVFVLYIQACIYVPGPLRRRRSFVFKQFRWPARSV